MLARWLYYFFVTFSALGLIGVLLVGFAALVIHSNLPSLETLTDYRPKIPLRIYSDEGLLIGEFGAERRNVVNISEVPAQLKQAILAAEDDRFYEHGGVDYLGVLRAAYSNFSAGSVRQGASTITMQVARNFFLTREKTLTRKFSEALLAFKIENNLSKDNILELYVNQIYLGQRSYGFAAAAQTYFGKSLQEINIAEAAMLAGLPKAPSSYNPISNPKRAKSRQLYVLGRLHKLNYISSEELRELEKQPISVKKQSTALAMPADYVAEMVRQVIYDRYQEETYSKGIKVYTTIRQLDQTAAYQSLRKNIIEYDKRRGYRGPEAHINLLKYGSNQEKTLDDALEEVNESGDIYAAIVLSVKPNTVQAYRKGGEVIEISGEGLKFAQKFLADKKETGKKYITPGTLIRIQKDQKNSWHIAQLPEIEAALVSLDPNDGAIRALIGGFDFHKNQFNHVTQAWRQPGSSFKPFIYSAALEKGFTPATIINDAPLAFSAAQTGSQLWEPKNFDGKFEGPMRLRTALVKSKNLVSIRILQAIGIRYAQDYITRFGFDASRHPPYLPMALGSGSVTPMQMAAGYAIFANGGFRVTPYFIRRIEDEKGNTVEQFQPTTALNGAKRVIDPRNAYIMTSMMQDVINHGTAIKAKQLGRSDLAGKTGTTSNFVDAWFCGFQKDLVTIAWTGYDEPRSLGNNETGGRVALPIWMDYMGPVLKGIPMAEYKPPNGVFATRINSTTGFREPAGDITEYFFNEQLPPIADNSVNEGPKVTRDLKDQLF
ncbi:MAG: penicillin-binding protein 1A [Nitrosomonas sp.]|uniref:penicillin-binding protein 1A n=1 Tax=Nitrosomonas sp. TaxID=42353 RepID=UPI00272595A0|nr:penicillin-binding protein 1A [Nitrosomonas sp.]MDO8894132.1 penicillin-binding protein 1A [Nitrosomonas sp.]MDO9470285.1 penicillin-binding protein 1A [Nitrosomonas sp.]MDP1788184.1 penicillin-binding protein 1A [Nitrosomonas sp.]MDP2223795.1 penicillin-binding protein 1A [Nitrosomonas sp.]